MLLRGTLFHSLLIKTRRYKMIEFEEEQNILWLLKVTKIRTCAWIIQNWGCDEQNYPSAKRFYIFGFNFYKFHVGNLYISIFNWNLQLLNILLIFLNTRLHSLLVLHKKESIFNFQYKISKLYQFWQLGECFFVLDSYVQSNIEWRN